MNNKILFANETVTLTTHFLLCMFSFVTAQILILGEPAPWYEQLIFITYFGIAIAIRILITSTFFIFIGLHLLLFVTVYFLPINLLLTIECIILLLVLTLQSIDFWKRNGYRQNASIPWPSVMTMFGFYIYAIATHHQMLCNFIYIVGSVYLLLYLARLYLTGLYEFANAKANIKRLPLKQIVRTNSTLVGLIIAVIGIAIILSNIFNLDHTIFSIGEGLLIILRYLAAGVNALFTWLGNLLKGASPGTGNEDGIAELFSNMRPETSLFTTVLDIIFKFLQCVIFGFLLFWIFRGMYRIARRFLIQNLQSGDQIEGLSQRKQDELVFLVEDAEKLPSKMPRSKIRRQYKKAVLRHKKDMVLKSSMTTNEIHCGLSDENQKRMQQLKKAYEEERYSH